VIIGWTGHRPDLFADPPAARLTVRLIAAEAARLWPSAEFVTGGQRGVDTWAALAAIRLRRPFHLVLPRPADELAAGWVEHERTELGRLVDRAASVAVIDPQAQRGALAYDLRNEAVASRSDLMVAVWTGLRMGGTFFTLSAARHRGRPVVERVLAASGEAPWGGRGL
jgi:hypothetical protein